MIILWILLGLICYFGVIYLHLLVFKQECLICGRKSTIENIIDEMDGLQIVMFIPVLQIISLVVTSLLVLYDKIKHFEL